MHASNLLDDFLQNARYTAKCMRRKPSYAALIIGMFALGIGINTALFALVNSILLQPLPFPNADRLISVYGSDSTHNWTDAPLSVPDFADLASAGIRAISALAAVETQNTLLVREDGMDSVRSAVVSSSLFTILGIHPLLGRTFDASQDQAGGGSVVIIAQHLWRREFHADPQIVGRKVILDRCAFTIIGVTPDINLPGIGQPYAWLPLSLGIQQWNQTGKLTDRGQRFLQVVAELKSEAAIRTARAELSTEAFRLAVNYPATNSGWSISAGPLKEKAIGDSRMPLLTLFSAVAFVLLLACANVTNMQLANSVARRHEIAVRIALGAGRWRLVTQMLTENLIFTLTAGACGFLFAKWSIDLLITSVPAVIPRLESVHTDVAVLMFTIGCALLTGILSALAPIVVSLRTEPQDALKEGERTRGGGTANESFRRVLIASEIACAVTLLIASIVALRSFWELSRAGANFQARGLLTGLLSLPETIGPKARSVAYDELLRRIDTLHGVESAGATQVLPLTSSEWTTTFKVVGRADTKVRLAVDYDRVAGEYFHAMRLPLLRGRYLDYRDRADSPKTAVVNEAFARKYFPDERVLGAQLSIWSSDSPYEIVGVVGNASQRKLGASPGPMLYVPYAQHPRASMTVVVRTNQDIKSLERALRFEITKTVGRDSIPNIIEMNDLVEASLTPRRFLALLLCTFSGLAVVLTCSGVYGVVSYVVTQRTKDMAIRIAIGAEPWSVISLILRQSLATLSLGAVIGVLIALAMAQAMRRLAFQFGALDPATLVSVPVVMLACSALAAYVPAYRASRIDPAVVLRT